MYTWPSRAISPECILKSGISREDNVIFGFGMTSSGAFACKTAYFMRKGIDGVEDRMIYKG